MRSTIAALLIGAALGALGMAWIEGAPLPEGAEVRFEIAEPDWSWWPANSPKCPPLITRETLPARVL